MPDNPSDTATVPDVVRRKLYIERFLEFQGRFNEMAIAAEKRTTARSRPEVVKDSQVWHDAACLLVDCVRRGWLRRCFPDLDKSVAWLDSPPSDEERKRPVQLMRVPENVFSVFVGASHWVTVKILGSGKVEQLYDSHDGILPSQMPKLFQLGSYLREASAATTPPHEVSEFKHLNNARRLENAARACGVVADLLHEGEEARPVQPAPIDRTVTVLKDEQRMAYKAERDELRRATGSKAPAIIGESDAILRAWHDIYVAARDDGPVLILGETGTGKELCAKVIHYASARKTEEPLIKNCAGFSEEVLASEIFGHKRGAFTGADQDRPGAARTAQGSTLILDEFFRGMYDFGAMLNRLLEQREVQPVGEERPMPVNTRIIAMTNCEGKVPADVRARFPHIIVMPPLRERRGDIRLLADRFGAGRLTEAEVATLEANDYPENVRGLYSAIARIVDEKGAGHRSTEPAPKGRGRRRKISKEQAEAKVKETGGVSAAARALGVHKSTVSRALKG